MTDAEYTEASRAITVTVVEALLHKGASREDAAAVIGFSLLEAIGQLLGNAPAAITRLRDIADIAEAQILGGDPLPN